MCLHPISKERFPMNPYLTSAISEYAPIAGKALIRALKKLSGLVVGGFAFVDDID